MVEYEFLILEIIVAWRIYSKILPTIHEFCCLSVSVGGYQEIRKKGPHVGIT